MFEGSLFENRLGLIGAIRTKKFTLYQVGNSSLARLTRGTVSDV